MHFELKKEKEKEKVMPMCKVQIAQIALSEILCETFYRYTLVDIATDGIQMMIIRVVNNLVLII